MTAPNPEHLDHRVDPVANAMRPELISEAMRLLGIPADKREDLFGWLLSFGKSIESHTYANALLLGTEQVQEFGAILPKTYLQELSHRMHEAVYVGTAATAIDALGRALGELDKENGG
jgi:hypothetical protein